MLLITLIITIIVTIIIILILLTVIVKEQCRANEQCHVFEYTLKKASPTFICCPPVPLGPPSGAEAHRQRASEKPAQWQPNASQAPTLLDSACLPVFVRAIIDCSLRGAILQWLSVRCYLRAPRCVGCTLDCSLSWSVVRVRKNKGQSSARTECQRQMYIYIYIHAHTVCGVQVPSRVNMH